MTGAHIVVPTGEEPIGRRRVDRQALRIRQHRPLVGQFFFLAGPKTGRVNLLNLEA